MQLPSVMLICNRSLKPVPCTGEVTSGSTAEGWLSLCPCSFLLHPPLHAVATCAPSSHAVASHSLPTPGKPLLLLWWWWLLCVTLYSPRHLQLASPLSCCPSDGDQQQQFGQDFGKSRTALGASPPHTLCGRIVH